MGLIPKDQLCQLITENNLKTIEDVQKKQKRTRNSRNGYSKKTVTSECGEMDLAIPRDRLSEFKTGHRQKTPDPGNRD